MRRTSWMLVSLLLACSDSPTEVAPDTGPEPGGTADAGGGPDATIPDDILEFLRTIEGMEVEERTSEIPGYRFFVLGYQQPSDHGDTEGAWFSQRVSLLHRDRAAPMVLATSGYYGSERQSRGELGRLLDANVLRTEQRFFQPSRPEPADWTHLTIEQAAADHHRLVQALRPYYGAAWLATGASKGGMTSVYHRRFFPADLDGVVAYVAPLSYGRDDPRYVEFLAQVGSADCRARLAAFQVELLERRDAMVVALASAAQGQGLTFERLGLDGAFESAVVELPFSFWQYSSSTLCSQLPDQAVSDDELYSWLDSIAGVSYGADQGIAYFQPYYYQAFTQLGYPGVDTSHLDALLEVEVPMEAYLPDGVDGTFDAEAMPDVADWVATEGSELLFIYGEHDPWTAGMFELGDATDSHVFVVPGGNHGASIEDLPAAERDAALDVLGRWSGVSASFRAPSPGEPRLLPRYEPRVMLRR